MMDDNHCFDFDVIIFLVGTNIERPLMHKVVDNIKI